MPSAAVGPVQEGCERSERFCAVSAEQLWLLTKNRPKGSVLLKCLSNDEQPQHQQLLVEITGLTLKIGWSLLGYEKVVRSVLCCVLVPVFANREHACGQSVRQKALSFLNPLIWLMDRVCICPQQSEGGIFLFSCSTTNPSSHPSIPGTSKVIGPCLWVHCRKPAWLFPIQEPLLDWLCCLSLYFTSICRAV